MLNPVAPGSVLVDPQGFVSSVFLNRQFLDSAHFQTEVVPHFQKILLPLWESTTLWPRFLDLVAVAPYFVPAGLAQVF